MTRLKALGKVGAITMSLLLAVAISAAADEWRVQGDIAGKKGKASKDVSGIACASETGFPRTCLVIDDELQAAQVVTLKDGVIIAGELIPLINDTLNGKAIELDGEGVAFDKAKGFFYVIGSHGRSRGENTSDPKEATRMAARLEASSKVIRLTFDSASGKVSTDPAVPPSNALAKLIAADPTLAAFKDTPLEEGGITIEGVAILGDRLYAGFRGPVVKDANGKEQALILSVAVGHFFDGAQANAQLHKLDLSGRGVRDLAAYEDGILVLAGPVTSAQGRYSIFRWDGASLSAKPSADLPFSGSSGKPEALLPLSREGSDLRILILLDSAKNGTPQSLRIPYP